MDLRFLKRFLLGTILLFTAVFSFAEKINEIIFEQQGDYKFQKKMLEFNIQSRAGEEFDKDKLNGDIKRLYATGYFADIVSETRQAADGKLDIIIKLSARPRVKKIIFEGNKKFSTADLSKEVVFGADMPLNDNKLRESANKLREYYKGKGYNDATVSPEIRVAEKDWVNVVFKIKENLRLKINNVTFNGATVYSQWTLKNAIANQHSYLSWLLEYGLLDRQELDNDKIRLRELYWNKGYLDFKVEKIEVTQNQDDPEYVDLVFYLYEGKPYTINQISIAGNKIYTAAQLLAGLGLKKGVVYDNRIVNIDRDKIAAKYEVQGYADFTCNETRIPDYKNHTVDLDFIINEGRKYFVQDVNISGNRVTKDKVIRRELAIQPGDPLDQNRIKASKDRLMGMGYFKEVEAVTVNTGSPDEKDVNFSVKEQETFQFKIGGGFSDTDSLVGMVQVSNSNFDITNYENYFYGGGQRFRAQAMFGIDRNDFNIDFTEPWLFDIPLRFDLSGYWNQVDYQHWNERRIGVKTSLSKRIFDDFTSVSTGYKFEQVRVFNMDKKDSAELLREEGRDWVSQFSLMLERDTRDSLTEPTSGYQVSMLSAVSARFIGSSNNFYRLETKGSYYYSFLDKAIVCRISGKVGTVSSFNRSEEVPLYERYFLGGGDSLRGFPYREVSPVDNNGYNIGGQTMALVSAEVTHPIWKFIRGAVFVDAGNVWGQSYSFGNVNIGAGYGLRIKVPYLNAPVRLDLAYPVLSNQEDMSRKLRFHFNMGFTW